MGYLIGAMSFFYQTDGGQSISLDLW